jgi:predicted HD phosphohydrolase
METVDFRHMEDGTEAEYRFLGRFEADYVGRLPERILTALHRLDDSLSGYRVSRLEHSLQSATLAEDDGADEEMVLGALVHDLGDELAPANHSQLAAAIVRPYVRPEVTWVLAHHGAFQLYYYGHHVGLERHARERFRDHPWYRSCVYFCERYDQKAFDPNYPTRPLAHFEPLVYRIFRRAPFDPAVVGEDPRSGTPTGVT